MKTRSWTAFLQATHNSLLLGGTKRLESSRFETSTQAMDWATTAMCINEDAGRLVAFYGVSPSEKEPEIALADCYQPPTS